MSKIPCGGFEIGDGLTLDGKTLKTTGSGGLPEVTGSGKALVSKEGAAHDNLHPNHR